MDQSGNLVSRKPEGLVTEALADTCVVTLNGARQAGKSTLLPAPARISGQRHYPESAARLVGTILLHRDAGFTLAEQKALMASHASTPGDWKGLAQHKLAELDEQIARAQAARVTVRLAGQPLSESHQRVRLAG